jgi:hypothetical protein
MHQNARCTTPEKKKEGKGAGKEKHGKPKKARGNQVGKGGEGGGGEGGRRGGEGGRREGRNETRGENRKKHGKERGGKGHPCAGAMKNGKTVKGVGGKGMWMEKRKGKKQEK